MRTRHAAVATGVALVLAVTACSSDPADPTTDADTTGGELVIWVDPNRAGVLAQFQDQIEADLGVSLVIEEHPPDDLQSTFVTASQQGAGPDVTVGAHDWIGNLVRNGTVDPVQLSDPALAEFPEVAIEAVTFEGQTYGVPYALENLALIRNTELAPDAPATIEELVETGQQLQDSGDASEIMCLQVGDQGDTYHIYPLFTSGGGYLFGTTADGTWDPSDLGVDSDASKAAFEQIRELGEAGVGALKRSISGDNAIPTFTDGDCAFLVSGPWAVNDVKEAGIEYDITPVPPFEAGDTAEPFVGAQTFFVASRGENKAVAQEFVANYLTSTELAVALYEAEPRPPALTSALEQVQSADPDLAKFIEAAEYGSPMPSIPEMAAIWGPFGTAQAAIIGGADVDEALDAAAQAIAEQID
ncbi:maltose ABC transporter substrate-binding protein [Natronosporangium hydrolyticum]|uniref:Maltose ABC transporter substrate-binding protein n=1 Tax=Natronosporangium hydrolyticum TaxID=2811111 RepID=A0A895YMX5_9ACTN|nr:maltose ABC transporter substrate-binding protein [Natronosporangium hydrolyticum]QSB15460.1 maltose ABC transporter substrate-binding protein [Natronosporangium hydrolyticum]